VHELSKIAPKLRQKKPKSQTTKLKDFKSNTYTLSDIILFITEKHRPGKQKPGKNQLNKKSGKKYLSGEIVTLRRIFESCPNSFLRSLRGDTPGPEIYTKLLPQKNPCG
jgi:hypothetical protein